MKGFDPEKSDPAKRFLDYLFAAYHAPSPLSPAHAHQLISHWLASPSRTSQAYKAFENLPLRPRIVLNNHCPPALLSVSPYEGDEHFPAYQKDENIYMCLNRIKNKIELKENLDRELHIMLAKQTRLPQSSDSELERDKSLMRSLYEGCLQGYANYSWSQETQQRIGKKCAVYLFRRRSGSSLPIDSLFRYSSKLGDEVCN